MKRLARLVVSLFAACASVACAAVLELDDLERVDDVGCFGCDAASPAADGGKNPVPLADAAAAPVVASCAELSKAGVTTSGVYVIDPDGDGPIAAFRAHCDMVTEGGGFTLALKANGNETTFAYGSALWTNADLLNESAPDFDSTEAKLASFTTLPVRDVLVAVRSPTEAGTPRYLRIPALGASLRELFAGTFVATKVGRDAWKSLLAKGSLQLNCNQEGFNNDVNGHFRVRLGIFGNNEEDCETPNSFLGIGFQSDDTPCDHFPTKISCGNVAGCSADNGSANVAVFALLYVR